MPGSPTTPGWPSARTGALGHIAFHCTDSVGTRNQFSIAAQWLACTFPCRRFADILADACARLGDDVGRYSFIAVDLHHLLLAGLPAHLCENSRVQFARRKFFSIWSICKTKLLTTAIGGRQKRNPFYALLAHARFHAAWVDPARSGAKPGRSAIRRVGAIGQATLVDPAGRGLVRELLD